MMQEMRWCDYCGEVIRERKWYEINGDKICKRCLEENFAKGEADEEDEE